ncbi:MAG: hypothetical protein QW291_06065 [Thermofilaceae archaeon]
MGELDVRRVYIRVLPHEINKIEISEKGFEVIFKLTYKGVYLKVNRVRMAGKVKELHDFRKFIEIMIIDDEGNARVRAWNNVANKLRSFPIDNCIEVFGRIGSFRDETYIAADFFRTISDAEFNSYRDLIGKDRDLILRFKKINLEGK